MTIEALDEAALAKLFRQFARTECPPGGLYDRLCRIAADEPALLQRLGVAAPEQRRIALEGDGAARPAVR